MKKVNALISIVIPSKIIDYNLENCIRKIRSFYKDIKIFLVLDSLNKKLFDKNIEILISGKKSIGYKRNIAVDKIKTKYVCFIDSDAYPNSHWLNNVEGLFRTSKKIGAVGGPNLSPQTNEIEKILVSRIRKNSFVTLNKKTKDKNGSKGFIEFLPSCNLIVKTDLYKKCFGMYDKLYSGEEISLNYKIKKLGYKIIFDPKIYVYHMDRNFKHYARQRLIYGSTGLETFLKFPCMQSFQLLISSFPLVYLILMPFFLINQKLFGIYIFTNIVLLIFSIVNAFKINYKNNFIKSIRLVFISIYFPGIGFISRFILNKYFIGKFYTQK